MSGTLIAGGVAFLVAGALVPLLVRFAVGRNLLDVPNLRSSHEVPTPRLGGLAMICGVWAGVALLRPDGVWPVLAAATLVGLVGLADDLGGLHFGTKAIAQTLIAAGLVLFYPPQVISEAPGVLKIVVFVVGVFWIVALSNAFNFMDGIDGITGGVALVSALFLFSLTGGTGSFLPLLVGSVAGFLVWNLSPASIFAGDAGSYFLGFSLASAAFYTNVPAVGWTPLGFIAAVLVFTPYLFDTAYTLVRRLVAGKDVFSAHREHIYQQVTPTTATHRRTSNLYYGASVVAGFSALLVAGGGVFVVVGGVLAAVLCGVLASLPRLMHSR